MATRSTSLGRRALAAVPKKEQGMRHHTAGRSSVTALRGWGNRSDLQPRFQLALPPVPFVSACPVWGCFLMSPACCTVLHCLFALALVRGLPNPSVRCCWPLPTVAGAGACQARQHLPTRWDSPHMMLCFPMHALRTAPGCAGSCKWHALWARTTFTRPSATRTARTVPGWWRAAAASSASSRTEVTAEDVAWGEGEGRQRGESAWVCC